MFQGKLKFSTPCHVFVCCHQIHFYDDEPERLPYLYVRPLAWSANRDEFRRTPVSG